MYFLCIDVTFSYIFFNIASLALGLSYGYTLTANHHPIPGSDHEEYASGLILGVHPANDWRRYFVTTSLVGWVKA